MGWLWSWRLGLVLLGVVGGVCGVFVRAGVVGGCGLRGGPRGGGGWVLGGVGVVVVRVS